MNTHPIGMLDSGVGGLTVLQSLATALPEESIIYIGDSLYAPYGKKSVEEIYQLAKRLVEFLLVKEVKLIVIACNTITVSCLERLRNEYPEIPFIGTVPAIKTAAEVSRNKKIGILATTRTAESEYQRKLLEAFASDCEVLNQGTDVLVPLIEQGKMESPEMEKVLRNVLLPFYKKRIDTLVLGCTHFPFLRKQIQAILGPDVIILDSGEAIARQVRRMLNGKKALAEHADRMIQIFTTGDLNIAKKIIDSTIEKPVFVHPVTLPYDN